jgi:hypothetical protein
MSAALDAVKPTGAPTSRKEMLGRPPQERQRWTKAEALELNNHEANRTFRAKVALADLPPNTKVIPLTWAYAEKVGEDGRVHKDKARLAGKDLKGVWRFEGRDFDNATSSALPLSAFRVICAISAVAGNTLYQADFTGAYLQKAVPLDKKIYVAPPPGYPATMPGPVVNGKPTTRDAVYELGKYIYGLQEAGYEWELALKQWLTKDAGMRQSWVDSNLYWKDTPAGRMWVGVYVDDLIISVPNQQVHDVFVKLLAKSFVFTSGGRARHFLGINITQANKYKIQLSHDGYIRRMGDLIGDKVTKRVETPGSANLKKQVEELAETKDQRNIDPVVVTEYRKAVGMLLYSSYAVRADMSATVNMLCRCLTFPDEKMLQNAYDAIGSMLAMPDMAIEYDGTKGLDMRAFSDADWSVGPSTTGYVVFLAGGPVAWKSTKQRCISMSSCEAELIAANAAGSECIYVSNLVNDLVGTDTGRPVLHRPSLQCDNQSMIHFATKPAPLTRMKHLQRDYLKIREWVNAKLLALVYVPTKQNVADLFTKYLCPSHFVKLRSFLLVRRSRENPE